MTQHARHAAGALGRARVARLVLALEHHRQQLLLAELEHLPYGGDRRGYFAARVTEKQLEVDLRFVTSVEEPNGSGYHERTFVVESGNSGALGS